MKIKKNEEFISPERRQAHYNKHVSSKKYGEFKDGWEFPGGKIEEGETAEESFIPEFDGEGV